MASGSSLGRGRSTMSSTIHHRNSSDDREDLATLNQMTRDVVDAFKVLIEKKIKENVNVDKSVVESEVVAVRRKTFAEQCKISTWKKTRPEEVKNCSDEILIASIAYGNNPNEVKSVIQEKMNQSNTTNGSLNNVLGPLKKLKTHLDQSEPMNLLQDVRNIQDDEIERANRLFLSEALHFAPGLKQFNYQNAAMVVEGIRQSDGQPADDQYLLALTKTCHSVEEVRDVLEQQSKKSKKQTTSSVQSSRFDDEDRDTHEQQSPKPSKQTNLFGQSSRFDDEDRDSVEQQPPKRSLKQPNSFGQSSRFDDEDRDAHEQQPSKQTNSPGQNSRFAGDNRSNTSAPKTSNVSNSSFAYKPLEPPSNSPANSKPAATSRRFDDSSDDDVPAKPPPRKPERR